MATKLIGTHSGAFHCDQVLACLLLSKYVPAFRGANIRRTRDIAKLEQCDIIVDVGGRFQPPKWFDHHQKTFTLTHFQDVRLSSAGLVWLNFPEAARELCLSVYEQAKTTYSPPTDFKRLQARIYERFFVSVDANDNGDQRVKAEVAVNHALWDRIARLNLKIYEKYSDEACDQAFYKAMAVADEELREQALGELILEWSRSEVQRALKERKGRILELKQPCYWKENLFELQQAMGLEGESLFVISYTEGEKNYRVQAVPKSPKSFESRCPLRKDFQGQQKAKLQEISGVSDAVFCHATGFIGGADTKEGAFKLAELSIPKQ